MECTAPQIEQHLSLKTVAKTIDVSTKTLRKRVSQGTFPPPDYKRGRVNLWRRSTVAAWLDAGRTS